MRAVFGFALLLWSTVGAQAFDPVGLWRFHHTDGSAFFGRLYPDHRATTDFGDGETGLWRREGEAVRMVYTDGWDDLLGAVDGGFAKRSWEPGADRCGPPTNEN
ncbi:MAG TPA: hypothetical protein VJL84_12235, partial [Kiloniellales bacterium]|nr:hypothetical protein [Kiloniellales bacterium]